MALFGRSSKKSTLKASIKQTAKARENEGAKADQFYISAYQGFADVVKGDLVTGEALFNWGFALLHQAKTMREDSIKLYLEAISKFNFCLLVTPNHLGAAIDGGVAYMDLARIMEISADDELYDLAREFFENAERIQRGSAAYNFACIYALRGQEDACIEAFELSKECGSLPDAENILDDLDLTGVKKAQWFVDFMEKLTAEPEPEVIDDSVVKYDIEGNVIRKKKKKQFENEVDGVVYDVEGNVIRRIEPEEPSKSKISDKTESSNTEETKVVQKNE